MSGRNTQKTDTDPWTYSDIVVETGKLAKKVATAASEAIEDIKQDVKKDQFKKFKL